MKLKILTICFQLPDSSLDQYSVGTYIHPCPLRLRFLYVDSRYLSLYVICLHGYYVLSHSHELPIRYWFRSQQLISNILNFTCIALVSAFTQPTYKVVKK